MRVPSLAIASGVTIYLLAPGPSQSLLGSWPLTTTGMVVLIAAIGTLAMAWRTGQAGDRRGRTALAIGALVILRIAAGVAETPVGWMARYYANASWEGRPEWSSDFRFEHATRIDRTLSFAGTEFPTYYLNDARYTEGVFREVTEPMTVEWSGAFDAPAAMAVAFDVRANGSVTIAFDGAAPSFAGAAGSGQQQVAAGRHTLTVRYLKPADINGELHVSLQANGENLVIVPDRPAAHSAWPRLLATGLDLIAIGLLVVGAVAGLREALASPRRVDVLAAAALLVALAVQGFVAARPMLGRFVSLSGGDDWLGFESRARDVLQHGLLMTLGRPLGEGAAYFYHPFYSYVLALVHAVTGESLFGPIVMHFLVLAITAFLMWSWARDLFGAMAASCGLAALLVVFELDFIRYYTITLLSENFYILTVTLCLRAFATWADSGAPGSLIRAGIWAGLSAATRPAMMMFFVPALIVALAIAARRRSSGAPVAAAALFGASWLAVVAPFTIRNWVVAKKLVLISDSLGGGFIVHSLPRHVDPAPYLQSFGGGVVGSAGVLWRILMDHPGEVLALQVQKLGFTLGMVHWFSDYRPHPELVAINVLYLVSIVLSPVMRSATMWPVHAFVLAHVASMALTSPWNYGYRLILPPYIYTTTFSVAAAAAWLWPIAQRRASFAGELR
jgi:hypothetical protein